jgi:hypothetical protein
MSYGRLADFFAGLAALLAILGCGGGEAAERPVLRDIGYGPADSWQHESPSMVDEMADAGLRFVVTEHFPTVQAADWRKGEMLVSFPAEAREWNRKACDNDQTHIVFAANWNVLPIRRQPDEWWREVVNEVLSIYDPACTWIEPIAEPDEGDIAKARRWTQLMADAWPGKLIMPAAGAHWPTRRDFVDRHPGTVLDAERWLSSGDPRLLVITDGGDFVPLDLVLADLPRLAGAALASGVPFIVYADRWRGNHSAAIASLGSR